jgi:hypothetical protein
MCWPEENEETVRMIRDDPACQIIVATVAFGQGFNIRVLLDSLMLGVPKTVAQTLQQAGRVARDQTSNGRAVVFVQPAAYKAAAKYLAQGENKSPQLFFIQFCCFPDPARRANAKSPNKSLTTMNNEKALMLTVKRCLIAFFNKLYGNSGDAVELDCITAARRLPCSNCLPRFIGPLSFPPSPLPAGSLPLAPFASASRPPPTSTETVRGPQTTHKLTKAMRIAAEAKLRLFRDRVHKSERNRTSHGYTPASSYFPNPAINSILDHLLAISTVENIAATIPKWKYLAGHGTALLELVKTLQADFILEFETARVQKNAANRAKAKAKRRADSPEEELSDEDEDSEIPENDAPAAAAVDEPARPSPTRKRGPLEDATNEAPRSKRPRAPLLSAAVVSDSYRPQYTARTRRRLGPENIF